MSKNVTKLETVEPKGSFDIEIHLDDDVAFFYDILGYQIGSEWAAISMKDGTTFAYPCRKIALIKHYPSPTKE